MDIIGMDEMLGAGQGILQEVRGIPGWMGGSAAFLPILEGPGYVSRAPFCP